MGQSSSALTPEQLAKLLKKLESIERLADATLKARPLDVIGQHQEAIVQLAGEVRRDLERWLQHRQGGAPTKSAAVARARRPRRR
jgi:hypothetical protein